MIYTCITCNTDKGDNHMPTISLRLDDEDYKMIQDYATTNNISLSSFIRETIMDRIEDELKIDEKYILSEYKKSFKEQSVDSEEVFKKLNV